MIERPKLIRSKCGSVHKWRPHSGPRARRVTTENLILSTGSYPGLLQTEIKRKVHGREKKSKNLDASGGLIFPRVFTAVDTSLDKLETKTEARRGGAILPLDYRAPRIKFDKESAQSSPLTPGLAIPGETTPQMMIPEIISTPGNRRQGTPQQQPPYYMGL